VTFPFLGLKISFPHRKTWQWRKNAFSTLKWLKFQFRLHASHIRERIMQTAHVRMTSEFAANFAGCHKSLLPHFAGTIVPRNWQLTENGVWIIAEEEKLDFYIATLQKLINCTIFWSQILVGDLNPDQIRFGYFWQDLNHWKSYGSSGCDHFSLG
jgi:hypothetical protein